LASHGRESRAGHLLKSATGEIAKTGSVTKRALDLAASALALVLLSLLFAAIDAAIASSQS
jgi:lipopolysaccharide/colanic/teichoic acid biosynthesis glycosyltransferase